MARSPRTSVPSPPAAGGTPTEEDAGAADGQPLAGRFKRFAALTGLSASVAARHVTQRAKGLFQSDENAARGEERARVATAAQMRATLGQLKGAAMKVGQMLATDPELMPKEIAAELAQLQHSAPPMPDALVREVIESSLGQKREDVFPRFDVAPLGAASIGQVHRARTAAGQDVAVKIQYPGIAETVKSDLANLGSLLVVLRAQLPGVRVDAYLDEVKRVIAAEADYEAEAANLERFQFILKRVEGVRVPVPVHELTRKNILTMELFDGTRLDTWLSSASPADRAVQGRRLLDAYVEMIHRHGVLHADPHPGNFLVLNASNGGAPPPIGILDLGCVRDYDTRFLDGLLRMLQALWRHDLTDLQAAWRDTGFIDKGVDPELVYEWLTLILEPLLVDRVTDFGAWTVQDRVISFVLEHPSVKLWAPPQEAIFYLRVLVGLRSLLHSTGVALNVHAMSRAIVKERAAVPGTGLRA